MDGTDLSVALKAEALEHNRALPFLKWAGGKRWLIDNHPQLFPTIVSSYIEPFLGSGAVFFSLLPPRALLSDANVDLINTFKTVKDEPEAVFNCLYHHHCSHCLEYYYLVRARQDGSKVDRAARFIYLNRTCWNGLYRVNRKGLFNTPIGTKTNVILASDDFGRVAHTLKRTDLVAADFDETLDRGSKGASMSFAHHGNLG